MNIKPTKEQTEIMRHAAFDVHSRKKRLQHKRKNAKARTRAKQGRLS